MKDVQPSFTDVEYGMRRRSTRRETFLTMMDEVIPWTEWVGLVEPHYYRGERGRKPRAIETMLRMYLLQVWFSLSDEGVEEAIYDSHAMRRFMRLDFSVEQVPDATTLLHFRHLLEKHQLGKALFEAQNRLFEENGWVMRGGSVIDATLIAAPSSTKNRDKARDPEMHQTRKGKQWYFGMKAHIGTDAGTGYVHTVTATAANVHDLDQAGALVRDDDRLAYADAGYQGIEKRASIASDPHLSTVEFRVAARKGILKQMTNHERAIESRKAAIRARVEHPFLVVKRDFGFRKTRYRGLAKNLNLLHIAFTSANLLPDSVAEYVAGTREARAKLTGLLGNGSGEERDQLATLRENVLRSIACTLGESEVARVSLEEVVAWASEDFDGEETISPILRGQLDRARERIGELVGEIGKQGWEIELPAASDAVFVETLTWAIASGRLTHRAALLLPPTRVMYGRSTQGREAPEGTPDHDCPAAHRPPQRVRPRGDRPIMMQQSWSFECAIDGIAIREDFRDEERECDSEYDDGLSGSDVFIVEGRQERYGSKEAWAVSRRSLRGC